MADYFTQFSCLFDVGTAARREEALGPLLQEVQAAVAAEEDDPDLRLGFEADADGHHGEGAIWIHADNCGEPGHVLAFVRRCAAAFGLRGRWGFAWSLSCSKPRTDGFGGGAHVLDLATGETVGWIDCEHWLVEQLDAGRAAPAEAAP